MKNLRKEPMLELEKSDEMLKHETGKREKTEASIGKAQKEINQLISSLPTILIGLSQENKIVLWNSIAEKVFDRVEADVMGRPLNQCGVDWDWDKIASGIAKSQIASQPIRVDDIRFQKPDGEERYLGMTINYLAGDNESILGTSIIGADITDRIKIETQLQQSQKMEALGQLAAGIAHEINTPTQFVGDNTRFFQDAFEDLITTIRDYENLIEKAKTRNLTKEIIAQAEDRLKEIELDYLAEEIPIALQQTLKCGDRSTQIGHSMNSFAQPGMVAKEPGDMNKEI
jgi:PAS domain S-box-containing protein